MKIITNSLIAIIMCSVQCIYAQKVYVEVSYDTVYAGNVLAVKYSMENWQGELIKPEFGEMEIVGGPQITSSMSYTGGNRTSTKTIIFFLKPPVQPARYIIPSQTFRGEKDEATTEQVDIIVVNNPEEVVQKPIFNKANPRTFDKKYKRNNPARGQRQRF